jgi:hypothetical protein
VIEVAGDEATQECTLLLTSRLFDENRVVITIGRYVDRLVRTGAGWRFASREAVVDAAYEGEMPMHAPDIVKTSDEQ